jgi:polysaccharide export outer membrane protein
LAIWNLEFGIWNLEFGIMKVMQKLSLVVLVGLSFSLTIWAQEPTPSPTPAGRERVSKNQATESPKAQPAETPSEVKTDGTSPNPTSTPPTDADDTEIKNAIVPYYDSYLSSYPLGPTDVISVDVFGQPNYSKAGITIPPTGAISYPLIPGGVFVGGKTTDQVAKEIAKKLDEYIIDPQVTVTLEKVGSAQFAVLGKVGAPGVRLMTRRYSVYDAIVESGGIQPGADKKRIMLMRRNPQGSYSQTFIKLDEMVAGKVPMEYLNPGDQLIIPEKKWSMSKILDVVGKASAFRILFGSPF